MFRKLKATSGLHSSNHPLLELALFCWANWNIPKALLQYLNFFLTTGTEGKIRNIWLLNQQPVQAQDDPEYLCAQSKERG